MQRYESQTNASRVKLMGQFTSSRLKKNCQDPDPWISELELMRIRLKKMGSDIDDDYLMMHIMNNLPSAYDGLMENLEDKLDSALDPLTMGVLRNKISEKYERIKRIHGVRDYQIVMMRMRIRIRMRMRKLFLPRYSRVRAASVESLVTRLFNARMIPTRRLGIQVKAEMMEESTK